MSDISPESRKKMRQFASSFLFRETRAIPPHVTSYYSDQRLATFTHACFPCHRILHCVLLDTSRQQLRCQVRQDLFVRSGASTDLYLFVQFYLSCFQRVAKSSFFLSPFVYFRPELSKRLNFRALQLSLSRDLVFVKQTRSFSRLPVNR